MELRMRKSKLSGLKNYQRRVTAKGGTFPRFLSFVTSCFRNLFIGSSALYTYDSDPLLQESIPLVTC